jgi:membrane-bound lytic murein transglycosylase D
MKKQAISLFSLFTLVFLGKMFISSSPGDGAAAYQDMFNDKYNVFALNLPADIYFCGEKVPMEDLEVRERFDRELHINTYWQSQTILLIKRANRYFPIIRPILKKNGIPEDFKYLPLVESGFIDMVSPAGAEGPWQFMTATARVYNLEVSETVDERYNIAKATEAACDLLKDAYKQFGNWTLVAASYNVGHNGLQRAMNKQGVSSYYDLDLNNETSRYIFRLLAIKEIMEHPKRYGFRYKKYHLYQPFAYTTLKVDTTIHDLVSFAKKQGITYKTLKEYNPWLKSDKLMNSSRRVYSLRIPKYKDGKVDTDEEPIFEVPLQDESFVPDTGKSKVRSLLDKDHWELAAEHMVMSGENYTTIAKKYKVRPGEILVWNGIRSDHDLKPGQVLKIYHKVIGKERKDSTAASADKRL